MNRRDNKLIGTLPKLVLKVSKTRRALYNNLNEILAQYPPEEELLNILSEYNRTMDKLTLQLFKDRFNYLKYKYENILKFIKIEADYLDIYQETFVSIEDSLIIINPIQVNKFASYFKLPIEKTLEIIILHEIGHILDEDIDLDKIYISNRLFIKNAKDIMLYRIEKENCAWNIGSTFSQQQEIKYKADLYKLLRVYSIGSYVLHYRDIAWCSLSV